MLAMVLTILKFIGITILIILGILLFVVCLILFVPIRYKAEGYYRDSYRVSARISWLLHIVSFAVLYEKNQPFQMKLRILGIPVYDNQKKKVKTKKKKSKETIPELVGASTMEEKPEPVPLPDEAEKKEEADIKKDKDKVPQPVIEEIDNTENQEKISIFQKLKLVFTKTVGIFRNIKYTFQSICDTIRRIKDNITYYVELFKQDSTKAAIAACKKQLLRICKNLKPQKFQVNLHIGMEDPSTMGEILGVWGMLYPIHQGHIDICPDFEQAVLEGDFYCKGRVTVYIYIWTVINILFDKDISLLRKCLVRKGK